MSTAVPPGSVSTPEDDARRVLDVLSALAGTEVGMQQLGRIAEVADTPDVILRLQRARRVVVEEGRVRLLGPAGSGYGHSARRDAAAHFAEWANTRPAPEEIATEAPALLFLAGWAAEHEPRAAVWLARAVEGGLALSGRWAAWISLLKHARAGAVATEDSASVAWADHQLGTCALCCGERAEAEHLLRAALDARIAQGDEKGAAVTRHNLDVLLGPPPPDGRDDPRPPPRPRVRVGKLAPALAGAAAIVLLAGVAVARRDSPDPRPPRDSVARPGSVLVDRGDSVDGPVLVARPVVPERVDFGDRPVRSDTTVRVVVRNAGNAPLAVHGARLATQAEFVLRGEDCPDSLPPGRSCAISVGYGARALGSTSDVLTLDFGGRGKRSVRLTARAVGSRGLARASTAPSALVFAERVVGTTGRPLTVTVTSTGEVSVTVVQASVTGAAAGDFAVVDGCRGRSLVPGERCTVEVTFAPSAAGPRRASLAVSLRDGQGMMVPLEGTGLEPVPAEVSPAEIDFGEAPVAARDNVGEALGAALGGALGSRRVRVRNPGPVPLDVGAPRFEGEHAGDFGVVRNGCRRPVPAGGECTVTVAFMPTALGRRGATVALTAAGRTEAVELRGVGVPVARDSAPAVPNPIGPGGPGDDVAITCRPGNATWRAARGALQYELAFETRGDSVSRRVTGTSGPLPPLGEGQELRWRVRAISAAGVASGWSRWLSIACPIG